MTLTTMMVDAEDDDDDDAGNYDDYDDDDGTPRVELRVGCDFRNADSRTRFPLASSFRTGSLSVTGAKTRRPRVTARRELCVCVLVCLLQT